MTMATVAQTNIQLYRQLVEAGWSDIDLARCASAYEFALPLFATRFRANGKPFLAHLTGVASLLATEGEAADIIIAGLLHAVYDQARFGRARFGLTAAKRAKVTHVVGKPVAMLVEAYHTFVWNDAVVVAMGNRNVAADPLLRQLLIMRLANEVEDNLDCAACFSAKPSRPNDAGPLAALVRLAVSIGAPSLAAALTQSHAATQALEVPTCLVSGRQSSFSSDVRIGLRARLGLLPLTSATGG